MSLIFKDAMIEDVTINGGFRVHRFTHGHWFGIDVGCMVNDVDG